MTTPSQIHITLNGQSQSIPADGDVRALLRWLKIDPEVGGLAVAINAGTHCVVVHLFGEGAEEAVAHQHHLVAG